MTDLEADLKIAQARIKELEAKIPKWVSVEDRLPEVGVTVLVYNKTEETYFSHRMYYHLPEKPFLIEYSKGWEVTHWMPLPEAPKEE